MKKKILLFPVLLFFSLLPLAFFSSCDKDTNCYLDVLTVDEGTRAPISGVKIEIKQEASNHKGTIHDEGVTGADGIYSTHFSVPAILQIKATYEVENGGKRIGETTVRLKEGETKTSTVTIPRTVSY